MRQNDNKRKGYRNQKWIEFSLEVQKRDNFQCLRCGRKKGEVTLQTHHTEYKEGLKIWEYPLSDCITLCKGCHAKEHGLIEPSDGWTLIDVVDLGSPDGICERKNCGQEIRYEHLIYHPRFGYLIVGSKCVEYLTDEDKKLSHKVELVLKNISKFVNKSVWKSGTSTNGKDYIYSKHDSNEIRIYGKPNLYAYQLWLKRKGFRKLQYNSVKQYYNKDLIKVKEIAYIELKKTVSKNDQEKSILENIYQNMI